MSFAFPRDIESDKTHTDMALEQYSYLFEFFGHLGATCATFCPPRCRELFDPFTRKADEAGWQWEFSCAVFFYLFMYIYSHYSRFKCIKGFLVQPPFFARNLALYKLSRSHGAMLDLGIIVGGLI